MTPTPALTARALLTPAAAELAQAGVASPRLTAEVLLAHALGRERAWLFAHGEEAVAAAASARFRTWVSARAGGTPLQYLTGEQEFYGRTFQVSPAVLIPRPETEQVLELALARLPLGEPATVLDVGTGSGCLAISLALERPAARVTATDISSEALAVARANADRLGARVSFVQADLTQGLDGRFDLIVSNPPYVAEYELAGLQREVREHEPRAALVAGPLGTEIYARLIPPAEGLLRPGGWLVLELGHDSAGKVRPMLGRAWEGIEAHADLQGWPRVLTARRAAASP